MSAKDAASEALKSAESKTSVAHKTMGRQTAVVKPRFVILPGIHCLDPETAAWYGNLRDHLVEKGYEVVLEPLPDIRWARSTEVLPWIKSHTDNNTVLIGHCMGALSICQYLQTETALGALLVAPCVTSIPYDSKLSECDVFSSLYWQAVSDAAASDSFDALDYTRIASHVRSIWQSEIFVTHGFL